jgi:hypothetical protein
MSSALSSSIMPPAAPNPNPQGGAPGMSGPALAGAGMPQGGSALAASGASATGGGSGAAPSPGGPPPPPPGRGQTVAALRHFSIIENEVRRLLADPECGKSDMRSEVIDGITGLVAKGITTAADAVRELSNFPDKPFDQKAWLEAHLSQSVQASNAVLQHHRMAFAGQDLPATDSYDPDNHTGTMAALTKQYQGAQHG